MSVDGAVRIDMAKYGMTGEVVVREPRLTRRRKAANAIGRVSGIGINQTVDLSKTSVGDLNTILTLTFVDSAPFPTDLENLDGFFDYCDKMDDIERGNADKFWDELCKAVTDITEGRVDPLGSFAMGSLTTNSD